MGRSAAICGLLVLAVAAVYGQVASHEFVRFDDQLYITENPHVRAGLGPDTLWWALTGEVRLDGNRAYVWQPLTWLSYLVDAELHGTQRAGPWLLTNAAWHAAGACMLLAALVALTGRFWPSAFAAALFALHPIQTEPVAWASGRRDVLAGFFVFLTLWAYARYARRPAPGRYLALLGSMLLCLAAKGSQVALPFLLLLLDYWPLGRLRFREPGGEPLRELLIEKLPLLLLALTSVWVNLAPVSVTLGPWATDPPLPQRAADGVLAYAATLGRLLWPDALAIVHPTRSQMGLPPAPAWQVAGVLAALLAATGLAAAAGRRRGYLLVGWLWFLGMLFPLIGLIPSGLRVMHDRYAYVPMVGLAVAVAFGTADLIARRRATRAPLLAAAAAVLLASGFAAHRQAGVWRDSLTLFDHALAVTKRNAIIHFYRGNAFAANGDLDAARREFDAALAIRPDYPDGLQALGHVQLRLGRPDLAVPLLERAVAARPQWGHVLTNLGLALWAQGERERALATLEDAVAAAPQSVDARHALAAAYHESGQLAAAAAAYREVLRLDPTHAPSRRGLALLRAQGK